MSAAKTKPKVANSDTRPRQDFSAIVQEGIKAQNLATQNATAIGARLSATWLTSYAADLAALPDTVPTVIATHDGAVQLTAAQASALEAGYNLVRGLKETVKSHNVDKNVLLAYGVGTRVNKLLVKEVVAAIQKIVARVQAAPAEAAGFDIVAADTTALQAALAAIQAADTAQEAGRAAAPQSTAQRNATARRVLAGDQSIAGGGHAYLRLGAHRQPDALRELRGAHREEGGAEPWPRRRRPRLSTRRSGPRRTTSPCSTRRRSVRGSPQGRSPPSAPT